MHVNNLAEIKAQLLGYLKKYEAYIRGYLLHPSGQKYSLDKECNGNITEQH